MVQTVLANMAEVDVRSCRRAADLLEDKLKLRCARVGRTRAPSRSGAHSTSSSAPEVATSLVLFDIEEASVMPSTSCRDLMGI